MRIRLLLLALVLGVLPGITFAEATGSLFSDGFESGDLSAWTGSEGVVVQDAERFTGSYAARATAQRSPAYASAELSSSSSEVYLRARFEVLSRSTGMRLLRLRTASGSAIATLALNGRGALYTYNHISGRTETSSLTVAAGAWLEVQLHVLVGGTNGRIDVWVDNVPVAILSRDDSFGTTPIGQIQVGDTGKNRRFDAVLDDVDADTVFIGEPDEAPPSQPTGLVATAVSAGRVDLSWQPSTDNVGVGGYTVYRNGGLLATLGNGETSYVDGSVAAETSYSYAVDAFDLAGNHSSPSDPALVTTPAASGDPVVAAAGDIACDPNSASFNGGLGTASRCKQMATSDLIVSGGANVVLPLGDVQYDCGGSQAFGQSYHPSWGRAKAITRPVPGNHEYLTSANSNGTDCSLQPDASGYFSYFGASAGDPNRGYYSLDVGSWHVIALNSECSKVGGCQPGSAQEQWLRGDLAANPVQCTLAFWHKPRFASSNAGNNANLDAFWRALHEYRAEVVLVGHFHAYERFAPQDPDQNSDPNGIRQFIVGTGGSELYNFSSTIQPNSQVRSNTTFGVLFLTLRDGAYDWSFRPTTEGGFTDSGSNPCH